MTNRTKKWVAGAVALALLIGATTLLLGNLGASNRGSGCAMVGTCPAAASANASAQGTANNQNRTCAQYGASGQCPSSGTCSGSGSGCGMMGGSAGGVRLMMRGPSS